MLREFCPAFRSGKRAQLPAWRQGTGRTDSGTAADGDKKGELHTLTTAKYNNKSRFCIQRIRALLPKLSFDWLRRDRECGLSSSPPFFFFFGFLFVVFFVLNGVYRCHVPRFWYGLVNSQK